MIVSAKGDKNVKWKLRINISIMNFNDFNVVFYWSLYLNANSQLSSNQLNPPLHSFACIFALRSRIQIFAPLLSFSLLFSDTINFLRIVYIHLNLNEEGNARITIIEDNVPQ